MIYWQCMVLSLVLIFLISQATLLAKITTASPMGKREKPCTLTEHPYLVSIRFTLSLDEVCIATLMSELWVLTAAHCCLHDYRPGTFSAYAAFSQVSLIIRHVMHPDYNGENDVYTNVALMELETPIPKTSGVYFIKLPQPYTQTYDKIETVCHNAVLLSWGSGPVKNADANSWKSASPKKGSLQCIHIPAISSERCSSTTAKKAPSHPASIFCANSLEKEACQTEAGGPVICRGVQYGIVASKPGCEANKKNSGLYTRVDMYTEFIYIVIANSSNNRLSILLSVYLFVNIVVIINKLYYLEFNIFLK